ncbi:hypothetical protein B0J11DRAFT_436902 [Dendryphion nanum]|uniref:RNase MRP protein 1 RNA binding domain-containing protein n=1 Tax=Dendryphion nanum TaxID=256645 RepID=A0A9P9DP92_9PLEO|nr:hypothetical protein B0J11DRAFT_436902 [Dendryphion nanum]
MAASTLTTKSSHPHITHSALLSASPAQRQSLSEIADLLHLLFVRNRNQHRRNHWFKSLQQFRKQLALLVTELNGDKGVAEKLNARLQYWDEKAIHQWYLHFTQLVAVGPFAVLGLVLMACTARVCSITGITNLYEEIASEDMQSVLRLMDAGTVSEIGDLIDDEGNEIDEGEVIARDG